MVAVRPVSIQSFTLVFFNFFFHYSNETKTAENKSYAIENKKFSMTHILFLAVYGHKK